VRSIFTRPILGSLVACAALLWSAVAVHAAEVSVQNDRLANGSTGAIQLGFVAGETAAAWLTSPCSGRIVAVQIMWRSGAGNAAQTIEDSIGIHAAGSFPTPGALLTSSGIPALLEGPVMTDGGLNEFRFMDENNTIPIDIPVTQGQVFVVAFTFFNSPGPGTASLVTDTNGCQPNKNSIDEITFGWFNLCLFGVSGDLVIRAIVDCDEVGACCLANGQCLANQSPANWQSQGGTYQGQGSSCGQVSCPQPGACCFPNGSCQSPMTSGACLAQGGTYQGAGTACATTNCPQPTGACCFSAEACLNMTQANCITAGGTWGGAGTTCSTFTCFPMGPCCMPDGSCFESSPEDCASAGGSYQGNHLLCVEISCPQPSGACCLSNGNCITLTQQDCGVIPNTTWAGPLTNCADGNLNGQADACEPPPAGCTGDIVTSATFNPPPDGIVDGADLAILLGEWGPNPGSPADFVTSATFNPPPDGIVDGADLAVLLGAWGVCD